MARAIHAEHLFGALSSTRRASGRHWGWFVAFGAGLWLLRLFLAFRLAFQGVAAVAFGRTPIALTRTKRASSVSGHGPGL